MWLHHQIHDGHCGRRASGEGLAVVRGDGGPSPDAQLQRRTHEPWVLWHFCGILVGFTMIYVRRNVLVLEKPHMESGKYAGTLSMVDFPHVSLPLGNGMQWGYSMG